MSHPLNSSNQAAVPDDFNADDKENFMQLRECFLEQYGNEAEPATILNVLLRHKGGVNPEDFWLCVCLIHPYLFPSASLFNKKVGVFDEFFNPATDFNVLWEDQDSSINRWSWELYLLGATDLEGKHKQWDEKGEQVLQALAEIEEAWALFREELTKLPAPIRVVEAEIIPRFEKLVHGLKTEIRQAEQRVEHSRKFQEEEIEKKNEASLSPNDAPEIQAGVTKTNSWTTGRNETPKTANMRNRRPSNGANLENRKGLLSKSGKHLLPFYNKVPKTKTPKDSYPMGGPKTVAVTVLTCEIIALVTSGLAAWKCPQPEILPVIDSNFWSTQTSAVVGLASLYCTIIPLLRKQPIKVSNEPLFYTLLIFSAFTATAGAACYAYQTRASGILLSLSGCAALGTTLQIIEGAVEKIVDNEEIIERQDGEISHLEARVVALGGSPLN